MGDVALCRRILAPAGPYWRHVGALFLLGLLSSPLALLAPLPLKIAVDSVIGSYPLPRHLDAFVPDAITRSPDALLAFAIVLLVAVALLGQLQGLASARLRAYLKEKLAVDFRARLSGHLQRLSLADHGAKGTSNVAHRVQHDAPAVQLFLTDSLIPFISATVTFIGLAYVMARIDWQLALVAFAVSPGLVLTAPAFLRLRRPPREVKKLTTAAGTAAALLIGIHHVRSGQITLGALLLVMGYIGQLPEPLRTIRRKAARLPLQRASAERTFAMLDEPSDVEERPDARPLARARGGIAFRRVCFRDGDECPLLHDISFEIEPGTRLGVAGASGVGKSALIRLLMRFCDPTEGQVRLDGFDLREFRLDDLRRQFAVVPPDPLLLSASVAENIGCAKPGASKDELIAAAQAANAHEFIVRLPHGYDTQVGERGFPLASGQRQRIAFARAFLTDSPVIILDEPTSAVDEVSEEATVVGLIRRLMRGRTAILITHRQSLLEKCTALVVLDNGCLVSDTSSRTPAVAAPAAARSVVSERRSNLRSHPAVQAWCHLYPDVEPLRVEPLAVRRQKNKVYRLPGAGRFGTAVIAKRCPKAVALVERTVYEEILPRVEVPSLRYYGHQEEPDGEHCWIFMEEATGADYWNLLTEHRAQAARWLGLLHSGAAEVPLSGGLPDAGPRRYLDVLRSVRQWVHEHLNNPVLSSPDVAFLERLDARLHDLAAHWNRVEEICHGVPPTLVHGDFNGKNIRLQSTDGSATIVVFDWEHAGWGVPAVDLAQLTVQSRRLSANPDVPTYGSTLRERGLEASPEAWQRLADCGTVFRTLSALSWDAQSLPSDWAHVYVGSMQMYADELEGALARLDGVRGTPSVRPAVVGI